MGRLRCFGLVCLLVLCPVTAGAQEKAAAPAAAKKKSAPAPTVTELRRLIEEQKLVIAEQAKRISEQDRLIAEHAKTDEEHAAGIEELKAQLALQEQALASLNRRVEELQDELPDLEGQKALEERLKRVEVAAQESPELPPDMVSAGDFPGSIRIPGTDAAIKYGGRIRTAGVFTLGPLGSEDRFLTHSIPVEGTPEAGKGPRTSFNANASRFNLEVRTPTGQGQMRAFIEGDFAGTSGAFRLRHAYAQYRGFIVGQTWSTFSDPEANPGDLDFEGINAENVIRQPLFRYWWRAREDLRTALAVETPKVSLTGGEGVNLFPDLHRPRALGVRRGGPSPGRLCGPSDPRRAGVRSRSHEVRARLGTGRKRRVPFSPGGLKDRFVFQFNTGVGNARYLNDLNSLGGQDGVFDATTGELAALPATGFYVDYQHSWSHWERWRELDPRSSFIWSIVDVKNTDFQAPESYHQTNRFCGTLVFSPITRIDVGLEYVYGTRENKDQRSGSSDQIQFVGLFRF